MVYKLAVDTFHIWKPYIFPSPLEVAKSLYLIAIDGTLWIATVASLKRLFIGYSLSIIMGVSLGVIIIRYKYLDENLSPVILGLQTLPSICWLPFSILWFGINERAIFFLIAIGSTFAITMATVDAVKHINPIYVKAARTMGAKGFTLYRTVIFPASIPSLITGLKQGWSFAWRALMAGEMLASTKGLGQVLMVGRDLADISQVVAIMVVIVVLGVTFEKLIFGTLEKKVRYRFGLLR